MSLACEKSPPNGDALVPPTELLKGDTTLAPEPDLASKLAPLLSLKGLSLAGAAVGASALMLGDAADVLSLRGEIQGSSSEWGRQVCQAIEMLSQQATRGAHLPSSARNSSSASREGMAARSRFRRRCTCAAPSSQAPPATVTTGDGPDRQLGSAQRQLGKDRARLQGRAAPGQRWRGRTPQPLQLDAHEGCTLSSRSRPFRRRRSPSPFAARLTRARRGSGSRPRPRTADEATFMAMEIGRRLAGDLLANKRMMTRGNTKESARFTREGKLAWRASEAGVRIRLLPPETRSDGAQTSIRGPRTLVTVTPRPSPCGRGCPHIVLRSALNFAWRRTHETPVSSKHHASVVLVTILGGSSSLRAPAAIGRFRRQVPALRQRNAASQASPGLP